MHFIDQRGLQALIRLPLGWCEFGHPRLLEILPDFKHLATSHGLTTRD